MHRVITFVFLLLCVGEVRADDAQTLARIDDQLAKLASFQYGQDGNPARELERTVFQLPADSPLRSAIEQKLIDALDQSNENGRGVICRQLRVIGTDKCVPTVATLLDDPKLSPFARYALEGIGSDAALKAMHDMLGKTSGTVQLGILNSLARRTYQPMRMDCVELMASEDRAIASAAIRALGRLGGVRSIATLTELRSARSQQHIKDIDHALLNCADQLQKEGDADAAAKVYSTLYQQDSSFRLAGLRGLVATRPNKATDLLVDAMRQGDNLLAASAVNFAVKVDDDRATGQFVALLDELPEHRKVLLIQSLGARGDASATTAISKAAQSKNANVRLAALDALGGLAGDQAVDALLAATRDKDPSIKQVARASLARIARADQHLAEVARGDDNIAIEAIVALAARGSTSSCDLMLDLAAGSDSQQSAAAIRAVGALGDAANIPTLVAIASDQKNLNTLPEVETSIGRILTRIKIPAERAKPILDVLSDASASVRPMLTRQLAKAGTPEALTAVRAALKDPNPKISAAAVQSLASWPNASVAIDLVPLIRKAPPEQQKQALDGYIRIASDSEDSTKLMLGLLSALSSLDNKKRVLNEIGLNCESFEAIETTQIIVRASATQSGRGDCHRSDRLQTPAST